jgi:hypothetical protein
MSIGHVVGLLRSGTTISGGTLSAFEQRSYVIVGRPALGVSAAEQRAYVVVGAIKDGIAVNTHQACAIVGIPASGRLGVAQHRAYAIVYP